MVGFNVPSQARSVPAPDSLPLLQTGPGGEYGRAYYGRNRRLLATAPLPNLKRARSLPHHSLMMAPLTLLERLLGIVHGTRPSRRHDRTRVSDLQRIAVQCRSSKGLTAAHASLVDYFDDRNQADTHSATAGHSCQLPRSPGVQQ